MNIYYMPPNNNKLIPLTVDSVYSTGSDITLAQARQELLKNLNNEDRLTHSPKWTKDKQDRFATCHRIVERYKQFVAKGLVDQKKPFSNKL